MSHECGVMIVKHILIRCGQIKKTKIEINNKSIILT